MTTFPEHHAFTNVTHPAGTGGIVVPQVVYKRASPSYPLFPTIHFHHGQQPGVSLLQVLNGQQGHVSDGDLRPITTSTSTKIKIRVMWPGYDEFSRDINAKEHTRAGDPIPKWKLALCVAQVVQLFYQNATVVGEPGGWDIRKIPFQSLRLLELRQVSTGSWQPVLTYLL